MVQGGGCWLFVIGTPPVTWAKMEFCVYVMEKGLWGDSGIKSCGIGRGLLGASTGQLWGFKARGHPNNVCVVTASSLLSLAVSDQGTGASAYTHGCRVTPTEMLGDAPLLLHLQYPQPSPLCLQNAEL